MQLGQELEVSRRLAAIGRLTAGVGHEVKNPINAMVVHLELLRGKLMAAGPEAFGGAQRHVEILAGRDAAAGSCGRDSGRLLAPDGARSCASTICGAW